MKLTLQIVSVVVLISALLMAAGSLIGNQPAGTVFGLLLLVQSGLT